ncbi:lactonase family protein [Fructilactobacillus cliffordii]|uniref:lactonase family protein n=1 Tax=Fructilactobacillus cliffordii TaxID=2940299 RepID=UPI002092F0D3|nr:lactonase family protein [Fructilactobacillus cliffordii]USS86929.1 lactonase family protein [Fructilactobacillus cliffordii]
MIEKFLIGTYTKNQSKGIYQIELDTDKPALQNLQLVAKAGSPTYVAESKAHRIYAVERVMEDNELHGGVVDLDGTTIPAKELQKIVEMGSSPAYITVDEKRQFVYTANYHTGDVTIFKIGPDGLLAATDRVHDHGKVGPRPEQADGPHPHYVDISFDGRLVVCDLGLDQIFLYDLTPEGKLELVSGLTLEPGFGPRHITYIEELGKAYLVGELSSKVAVLNYNEETAQFEIEQVVSTIPADWTEHNGAAAIHLSSDHRFIYVSNRGNDSIVVFAVQPDGKLKQIQRISTEGEFPRDFNFNRSEDFLIVANQNTDNATLFQRNADSGKLTLVQKDFTVPEGTCVAHRQD